jgi:hypothetical protein
MRLKHRYGLYANFKSFFDEICVVRLIRRAAYIPKMTVKIEDSGWLGFRCLVLGEWIRT